MKIRNLLEKFERKTLQGKHRSSQSHHLPDSNNQHLQLSSSSDTMLDKLRSDYYHDYQFFLESLTNLGIQLKSFPVNERNRQLKKQLESYNSILFYRLLRDKSMDLPYYMINNDNLFMENFMRRFHYLHYLKLLQENGQQFFRYSFHYPLQYSNEPCYRVVQFHINECELLPSKDRCPYLVTMELLEQQDQVEAEEGRDSGGVPVLCCSEELYTSGYEKELSTREERGMLMNSRTRTRFDQSHRNNEEEEKDNEEERRMDRRRSSFLDYQSSSSDSPFQNGNDEPHRSSTEEATEDQFHRNDDDNHRTETRGRPALPRFLPSSWRKRRKYNQRYGEPNDEDSTRLIDVEMLPPGENYQHDHENRHDGDDRSSNTDKDGSSSSFSSSKYFPSLFDDKNNTSNEDSALQNPFYDDLNSLRGGGLSDGNERTGMDHSGQSDDLQRSKRPLRRRRIGGSSDSSQFQSSETPSNSPQSNDNQFRRTRNIRNPSSSSFSFPSSGDDDGPQHRSPPPSPLKMESWREKKQRIQAASPFGHLKGWNLASFIVKANDKNILKEQLSMQIIRLLQGAFAKENLDIYLKSYRILLTGSQSAFIEYLEGTKSVDSIKKQSESVPVGSAPSSERNALKEFFRANFGTELSTNHFKAIQKFISSFVGYSLVTYLLQVSCPFQLSPCSFDISCSLLGEGSS
jgi:hypothetical protein